MGMERLVAVRVARMCACHASSGPSQRMSEIISVLRHEALEILSRDPSGPKDRRFRNDTGLALVWRIKTVTSPTSTPGLPHDAPHFAGGLIRPLARGQDLETPAYRLHALRPAVLLPGGCHKATCKSDKTLSRISASCVDRLPLVFSFSISRWSIKKPGRFEIHLGFSRLADWAGARETGTPAAIATSQTG